MSADALQSKYELTIGVECHVQLKTKTKLFARVSNDAREADPNTTVSAICFGLPGVLPFLNEHAVELAVRAGVALNAKVAGFSKFDRKHYFYPDLPKGYQITQYDQPIVGEGWVEIFADGQNQKIGVERAHLEEDAGKLTHPPGADYSLVDLNRAGTPLLEIVSKPDIKSPAAAKAYARELYLLMKFAEVSDVDLYHGNMRLDINISVAPIGSDLLGTRTEVKNLNSFKSVEKAAAYEYVRQAELLEKGQRVVQETRGWDEAKQKTVSQRSKEDAHDYRYFPDPDLPPVELSDDFIESVREKLPATPKQIRDQLGKLNLQPNQIEVFLDNEKYRSILEHVAKTADPSQTGRVASWLTNEVQAVVGKPGFNFETDFKLTAGNLVKLSSLVEEGKLSSTGAKKALESLITSDEDPAVLAEQAGLVQVSNKDEIEKIVKSVIDNNAEAAADVKNGVEKAVGFLVGQVMKESKGKANPQMVQELLKKQLGV